MSSIPTLCLNMIVKDESHIIEKTLANLCEKLKFDYWVICDTGSTDSTPEIIKKFFADKNIPGELHSDAWVNFAHNRTQALNYAFNKSDLLLVFDADDELVGTLMMPDTVGYHGYYLLFKSGNVMYNRNSLINNRTKWAFESVLHEYIYSLEPNHSTTTIAGDYHVVSGREGARSKNPNKYRDDAITLKDAYAVQKEIAGKLAPRYAYYCANSYRDANMQDEAIEWYKIALTEPGGQQEHYMSCLELYRMYEIKKQKETGFYYLIESFKYDCERVECVYILINHYCVSNMCVVAMNYYNLIKTHYENTYINKSLANYYKLFQEVNVYDFYLPYYMIIVCDKLKEKDKSTGIKMYEMIFTKKPNIFDEWYLGNLFFNLQFFITTIPTAESKLRFNALANEYIAYLLDHNVSLSCVSKMLDYGFKIDNWNTKTKTKFSVTECSDSLNLLVYTGYSTEPWNYTYSFNNALGGSEKAVAYLTHCFPRKYNIYVAGNVAEETIDNVHYVPFNKLSNLIDNTPFHTVIVSRYIAFYEMYQNVSYFQSYIWAHDTCLLPYGSSLSSEQVLNKWNHRITGCVCLTPWHTQLFSSQYPMLKNKLQTINNGICTELFPKKHVKMMNSFLYSSSTERGLSRVLELWPLILSKLPDAVMYICTYNSFPRNGEEMKLQSIIDSYDSILHLGKMNTNKLYELMDKVDFWLYPTHFTETSCITSLEMIMSKVIPVYYPVAGLPDTLNGHGIITQYGSEIDQIMGLTSETKEELRERGFVYGSSCTWKSKADAWVKMIELPKLVFYINKRFNHVPLLDYFNSLKDKYNVSYTNNLDDLYKVNDNATVLLVTFLLDSNIQMKDNYSFFNTEPLNMFLNGIIELHQKHPNMIFYDYSLSNIKLLNNAGINNTVHLPYMKTKEETDYLIQLNNATTKMYDYGIVGSDRGTNVNLLTPRRRKMVQTLMQNGFTVNIISGWKEHRDAELAKCNVILNIHGQCTDEENAPTERTTRIFEHIRCNRLLDANFNILSEDCFELDEEFTKMYVNLQIRTYDEMLNMVR